MLELCVSVELGNLVKIVPGSLVLVYQTKHPQPVVVKVLLPRPRLQVIWLDGSQAAVTAILTDISAQLLVRGDWVRKNSDC